MRRIEVRITGNPDPDEIFRRMARSSRGTHTALVPGRKRAHHDRLHLGIVIGALVVLAAWGISELVR